jgi:pimeloyl-ACP methyl ester carboxylesterase
MHAIDLPGHGLSDIPEAPLTPRHMAESVRAYLDAANIENAVLVGWSLGGGVSVELAALDPQRVRALVLLGAAAVPLSMSLGLRLLKLPFVGESMSLFVSGSASRRQASRDMYGPGFEPIEEVLDDYYRGWRVRGRAPYIRKLLGSLNFDETGERAKQIRAPAWVMHGEDDRIVPTSVGKDLAERLRNAQLVPLAGVGHTPHVERPDKVAATIRAALAT